MSIGIKIKKGLDITLDGAVTAVSEPVACNTDTVAIIPDDFPGFIPKMEVKEGDSVAAGQPVAHNKTDEAMKIVSPVSGTVKAIVRGERRKIERIVIENKPGTAADTQAKPADKATSSKEAARALLLDSGLWAMMRQRPYDIVPASDATFRDIFVTGFDNAPLAWYKKDFTADELKYLEAAAKVLSLVTDGKVYVSRCKDLNLPDIKGAEMVDMEGPHPTSLAGTLIAAIAPVNKGETVAALSLETMMRIGRLALTGQPDFSTIVAVTGSEVKEPKLVKTVIGAEISGIIKENIVDDNRHHRIISGNVLTGVTVKTDGYLRYPYTQITVIPEGDDTVEFMGWASFSPSKMSTSPTFPGHFLHKLFRPDARINGGRRAMIMSGEYDKVFPMDILPEYLLKAIISRDIDRMEQLGIYEVAPEDFALAEYVDTSKLELQKIVREGLDYLRKELS